MITVIGDPRASPRTPVRGDALDSAASPQTKHNDLTKSYTVEEDLKVLDYFSRPKQEHLTTKQQVLAMFGRDQLTKDLRRTYESIRDRYKRYLRFLSAADIVNIKEIVGENGAKYYLHFEKTIGSDKKLKKVCKEDPRPVAPWKPVRRRTPPIKHMRVLPGSRPKVHRFSYSPASHTKNGAGTTSMTLTNSRKKLAERTNLENLGSSAWKRNVIVRSDMLQGLKTSNPAQLDAFEIRDHVPLDYFTTNHVRLSSIQLTPNIKGEVQNFAQQVYRAPYEIRMEFDGKGFQFEMVKRTKDRSEDHFELLSSVQDLLGVSLEEAEQIYAAVSEDVNDLKAYIGGDKRVSWTQLEDMTLLQSLKDEKQFDRFYPLLVHDKGEQTVQRRIAYLGKRKSE
jgi:hypothetical protein